MSLNDLIKVVQFDFEYGFIKVFDYTLLQKDGAVQGSHLSASLCPLWASGKEREWVEQNPSDFPELNSRFQDDHEHISFINEKTRHHLLDPKFFGEKTITEEEKTITEFLSNNEFCQYTDSPNRTSILEQGINYYI